DPHAMRGIDEEVVRASEAVARNRGRAVIGGGDEGWCAAAPCSYGGGRCVGIAAHGEDVPGEALRAAIAAGFIEAQDVAREIALRRVRMLRVLAARVAGLREAALAAVGAGDEYRFEAAPVGVGARLSILRSGHRRCAE